LYESNETPCPKHEVIIKKGYYFNEEGKFRSVDKGNNKPSAIDQIYKFTNQKEYDELCNDIIDYIQQYLVLNANMKEDWVPLSEDNSGEHGANNIFYSSMK
jgi:hypothetical protein